MEDCRRPDLSDRYDRALREAVAYIFDRFRPVGVVAAGSILRGEGAPSSDLDLYVIHREAYRQRLQRYFGGVPAEVFVNPPEQVLRYFGAEAAAGRPISAHMLAAGFVVYQSPTDDSLARLRARAASVLAAGPPVSEAALLYRRYLVANALEDALDVEASDPETCAALLGTAVREAVQYRFWAARRWQPRPKGALRALAELDPTLAGLVRQFHGAGGLAERARLGRAVVERCVGATGFFEWESEPDPVALGEEG